MLRHFGSLRRIREATTDEIAAVKGLNRDLAAEIRRHLDEMTALLDRQELEEAGEGSRVEPTNTNGSGLVSS